TPSLAFASHLFFDNLTSVIVLPNKQILVGGYSSSFGGNVRAMDFVRLNTNGTVAARFTFNGGGAWDTGAASGMALQSDGLVVAAGLLSHTDSLGATTGGNAALRFDPLTFKLDAGFGSGGVTILPGPDATGATAVALQGNDTVLSVPWMDSKSAIVRLGQ